MEIGFTSWAHMPRKGLYFLTFYVTNLLQLFIDIRTSQCDGMCYGRLLVTDG